MSKQNKNTTNERRSPGFGRGPRMMGPVAKANDVRGTLLRLWGYLCREKWGLIVVGVATVSTSVLGLFGPYLIGRAIDVFIAGNDIPGLARLSVLMLSLYAIASLGTWIQNYMMAEVAQRTVFNLRNELFSKLQTLSLSYFDQRSHGEMMSRLTNDIDNISNILNQSLTQFATSIISIVGVVIMMLLINWRLALISITTIPLMIFLSGAVAKQTRKGFRQQQENLGKLNGIIEETVSGQRVVKAYVHEQIALQEFEAVNRELQRTATRAEIFSGFVGPMMNFVNNLGFAIVAGAGGWMAVQGLASVGTIASFINYARNFARPLNQIAQLYAQIQAALAGAERAFEVLDEVPEVSDAPHAQALPQIKGTVIFKDVNFGYQADTPVLKHVNLHAEPGQTIALVGPTGAGKTTIINLLTRFYDIDSGKIEIDGVNIRDLQKADLRRKLGIVLQDTYLFTDSVMENIRYGKLDASDAEVLAAAKLANADQFIHRLPQGYQTRLSERGSNLSQGQRQLLAIARCILADPSILILDEATSSVDTRTEKHIQEALLHLMEGRTSFVIAHRLSTIREADAILVINAGEVVETGTHTGLLEQQGFYHNLYMSQFKGQAQSA